MIIDLALHHMFHFDRNALKRLNMDHIMMITILLNKLKIILETKQRSYIKLNI